LYVSIGKQSNNKKALYHCKKIYLLIAIIIYQKTREKNKCSNLLMGSTGLSNRDIGQRQRLGITEPISLSGPTEYDVAKTRELEKVLFLRL